MRKVSTFVAVSTTGLSLLALLYIIIVILDKAVDLSWHTHFSLQPIKDLSGPSLGNTDTRSLICEEYYESISRNRSTNRVRSEDVRKEEIQDHLLTPNSKAAISLVKRPSGDIQEDHPFVPLSRNDVNSVKKFVFFIGYARSGHSIVASLLDAHPNMIIAHEFNLFRVWTGKEGERLSNRTNLYNKLYRNSYNNAVSGWRNEKKKQKGYSLDVHSRWQGKFEKLLVMGDKSGAVTTQMYNHSREIFTNVLKKLQVAVGVPIKVIHVVRNPYDIVSTRLLYADAGGSKSKLEATEEEKHCSIGGLGSQVNRTLVLVNKVQDFIDNSGLDILDIHLLDLIQDPGHVLNNICAFLGVDCPVSYIETCSHKVFKRVHRTRELVVWPQWLIDKVYLELIKPFRFFWRYSYSGN